MRIPALITTAALLLAACAPTAAPTPAPPSAQTQASACSAQGGSIQPVGRAQIPTCVVPYADGGKACADKSDCQGQCVLEGNLEPQGPVTGACQKTNRQFGCYARVVNGKATAAICVD
ncbi:hypothetical protein [Caulobacter sp.]|uniref:hypothetical protein n=1 Tax=Caulobacter sp. TaxID=78 RepID=UPI002B4A1B66|nr:hypothetical protein [Caulobacter sp.]HJV40984.1 hypothetical protein [Caulobacter sp.]